MSEFIRFVLSELKDILALLILAGLFIALAIVVIYLAFKKKHKGEKKFPWKKIILRLLFVGYLFILMSATILRKHGGFYSEYNLHLFRAWVEAWNNYSVMNWANVLLNVALFVPLGGLLPLLWKKCKQWYIAIPIGFGTSLTIELIQLIIRRGICDVDDLFANTLGTAIGFLCIMAILSLRNEKGHKMKPCLLYGGIALLPVLAICSIFIAYQVQEYGNLPQAATYTQNTKNVNWILKCELPEMDAEIPVYQTQTRSKADCDAFAEGFKEIINTEYTTISYYEEAAYYMDNVSDGGAHFLHVNYGDQGYSYSAHFEENTQWAALDRATVIAALAKYPLQIPETSEFTIETDGWHAFRSHQHIDGAMLFDGALLVRIAEDKSIREIKNQLLSYTYYEKASVISPEEAFALLKAGRFNDNGYFKQIKPTEITVSKCDLEYRVDTKGFYQPVYTFHLIYSNDSLVYGNDTFAYNIMIPAVK